MPSWPLQTERTSRALVKWITVTELTGQKNVCKCCKDRVQLAQISDTRVVVVSYQRDDFSHETLGHNDELTQGQQSIRFKKPESSQRKQLLSLSHLLPNNLFHCSFLQSTSLEFTEWEKMTWPWWHVTLEISSLFYSGTEHQAKQLN